MSKTLDSDTRGFIRTTPLVMRSLRLLFSFNLVVLLVVLLKTACGRSFAARIEKRTSRNYFARCGRGSSSSLERLSSAVPIKKILASFDVRENTAFFRLESCSSYSICFITKTNIISRKDFGAPNTVLWSKLVKEYQGKAPVSFSELRHRKLFSRTKLEDSCLHGFYVIGQKDEKSKTNIRNDRASKLSASILTETRSSRRNKGRRKKNGRRKPRRNKPKRNKHRKKKLGNRKRSAHACKTDDEFCVRRCIAWGQGDCVQLQISCNFMCPLKS